MNYEDKIARNRLKDSLLKLNKRQLKLLFGMLVHYWVRYKYFISRQNFFNLWCELNYRCAEVDESFPTPYDDHELLKSFCHTHPYYFIDILDSEPIAILFCEHLDDRLDVLATAANKLRTEGLWASYECCNEALGLSEDIDELVSETEKHLKAHS